MKFQTHSRRWASAIGAGCALAMLTAPLAQSALVGQLGILDLTANGGINPATNEAWKYGDTYRLVFITSTSVNSADSAMDSITAWNAAVQSIANAANNSGTTGPDLSTVTWNIVGSSADVDARDNTSTNPNVNSGYGIFAMNGSTVIANNFDMLWDSVVRDERPEWTENGDHMSGVSEAVPWSFTGTSGNGTADGSLYLKDTSGGGNIRQGRNQDDHHWINASITGANWSDSGALSVYGMSETLTVIPEPSTALLIGLGGLALLRRRR